MRLLSRGRAFARPRAPAVLSSASSASSASVSTAAGATGSGSVARNANMLEDVVNLCKRRGFVFPGSDIYGSIGTSFDYGPLGTRVKRNLEDWWWSEFIDARADCMPMETAIILNPAVWRASGHVDSFVDPLTECKSCRKRYRADKLIKAVDPSTPVDGRSNEELGHSLHSLGIACPNCGAKGAEKGLQAPRPFNLLFRTMVGPVEDRSAEAFLRPETAQGVYVHFANVATTTRRRLPFGVGQRGRSFRNEIATSNFIFRSREFDQMELQYFCHPDESAKWHNYWVEASHQWLLDVGLRPENVRRRIYEKGEMAHYALATTDLEYKYPFGWDELWGIANRGEYDLRKHTEASGVDLRYKDPGDARVSFFPHVIEPALGSARLFLAVMVDAMHTEAVRDHAGKESERFVLRLHERVAPFKAAVLPLMKRAPMLEMAEDVHRRLVAASKAPMDFDAAQSIGRRYRRQDEVGTPVCVTVDVQSPADQAVTLRCRDTLKQIRVSIDELLAVAERHRGLPRALFADRFAAATTATAVE